MPDFKKQIAKAQDERKKLFDESALEWEKTRPKLLAYWDTLPLEILEGKLKNTDLELLQSTQEIAEQGQQAAVDSNKAVDGNTLHILQLLRIYDTMCTAALAAEAHVKVLQQMCEDLEKVVKNDKVKGKQLQVDSESDLDTDSSSASSSLSSSSSSTDDSTSSSLTTSSARAAAQRRRRRKTAAEKKVAQSIAVEKARKALQGRCKEGGRIHSRYAVDDGDVSIEVLAQRAAAADAKRAAASAMMAAVKQRRKSKEKKRSGKSSSRKKRKSDEIDKKRSGVERDWYYNDAGDEVGPSESFVMPGEVKSSLEIGGIIMRKSLKSYYDQTARLLNKATMDGKRVSVESQSCHDLILFSVGLPKGETDQPEEEEDDDEADDAQVLAKQLRNRQRNKMPLPGVLPKLLQSGIDKFAEAVSAKSAALLDAETLLQQIPHAESYRWLGLVAVERAKVTDMMARIIVIKKMGKNRHSAWDAVKSMCRNEMQAVSTGSSAHNDVMIQAIRKSLDSEKSMEGDLAEEIDGGTGQTRTKRNKVKSSENK